MNNKAANSKTKKSKILDMDGIEIVESEMYIN